MKYQVFRFIYTKKKKGNIFLMKRERWRERLRVKPKIDEKK